MLVEIRGDLVMMQMGEQKKKTGKFLSETLGENHLLRDVFHHAPMGMVIVDDQRDLVLANPAIFRIFHQTDHDVAGKRFGNEFHCASAERDGHICGEGDRCQHCSLRNCLARVIEEQGFISDIELEHEFILDQRLEKKWFAVSATPFFQDERAFALVTFFDITRQKNYENLLYQQSITDSGSGALNKGQIMRVIDQINLGTECGKFSLAMIDFDHFKHFNDAYGHLVGDAIIRNFTEICLRNFREGDSIGRFGGEEFLLFFPQTTVENARHILARIGEKIAAYTQILTGEAMTFSGGLMEIRWPTRTGEITPDDPWQRNDQVLDVANGEDMVRAADRLLYQAKQEGRNRVVSAVAYVQNAVERPA